MWKNCQREASPNRNGKHWDALTKKLSRKYRILHRKFCAAECSQFFDITGVEKLRFTTRTSGKLFGFDRDVQWKMHLINSETLFVKSKIICKQFTSLKISVSDMEVRSHGSHTRSFFTLAPCTRNNYKGHRNHEKQISPMQIIVQN